MVTPILAQVTAEGDESFPGSRNKKHDRSQATISKRLQVRDRLRWGQNIYKENRLDYLIHFVKRRAKKKNS